ncbi:unnamed protein product [Auanema sp. JU1783]|nr:unnamed protein product [Auanema sp. JU1783]
MQTTLPDATGGGRMDTRKSLKDLAQLMLPALIEKGEGDAAERRNRRFAGNRLLNSAHSQIRKGALNMKDIAGRAHQAGMRQVERLQEKPPLCFLFLNRAYHKYGLKHVVLILVFLCYTAIGALAILIAEGPHQNKLKSDWNQKVTFHRSLRVNDIMKRAFNNSDFLVYLKGTTSARLQLFFNEQLHLYEQQLDIRWSDQKMEWDFWSALLFAGTICTTIGYGHIYPITNAGRAITMIFALFGIPLMLLVLQDIGKLLTITMKYPWFQTKRLTRRILKCCTKQSIAEMKQIEIKERQDLEVFDLPVPVGLSLVVIWVLVCSVVLSALDSNWTPFESFYFFFLSLSTVGLGDLVPSSPQLLLTMFGFILIGLSLVSMVINLLQMKMKKTYDAGKVVATIVREQSVTTLGIIQCFDDENSTSDRSLSRSTQTSLSLPAVRQVVLRSDGVHWVTDDSRLKSPDEVTQLVELESSLRVCEHIGENNNDQEDDENLLEETDVLLDVGEEEYE